MNDLEKIVEQKKKEIIKLRKQIPENSFSQLFNANSTGIRVIAEIKHKSPSQGDLFRGSTLQIVNEYQLGGADALSVVTDSEFFGARQNEFGEVRKATELPLLKKDFVISPVQVIEAAQLRTDAVLLIARIVNNSMLAFLVELSRDLGMVPVVEIFSYSEVTKALDSGAQCIAVNVRDLETGQLNSKRAFDILNQLPDDRTKLLFSGVKTATDVHLASQAGARGILVGTSLLEAKNRVHALKNLKGKIQ